MEFVHPVFIDNDIVGGSQTDRLPRRDQLNRLELLPLYSIFSMADDLF